MNRSTADGERIKTTEDTAWMCWLCRENEVGLSDSNLRYRVERNRQPILSIWALVHEHTSIKSSLNHVKDCDLGSSDCKNTEEEK